MRFHRHRFRRSPADHIKFDHAWLTDSLVVTFAEKCSIMAAKPDVPFRDAVDARCGP